jgi:xylulokinase
VEQVAATVPSDYLKKIGPEHRVFFGCHVARGRYFATGGIPTAGSLFRWYRDNFGREEMKEAEEKGLDVYDILAGEASTAEIGSGKLLVLPNFFGEGAMIGFDLSHGRKEVIRAILEGITFGMKKYIEESFESTGINVSELRAIGGGAKSDLWLQIKANVINRRIIVPSVTESTSLGAAMMAGIGVGIYKDEDDAVEKTFKKRKMFTPEPDAVERYEEFYRIHKDLEETLRPIFSRLSSLRADNGLHGWR